MTNNVSSDMKAENIKGPAQNETTGRENEAVDLTAAQNAGGENADAAGNPADGPVVTMKGVSGKVITGVVRVIKANKRDASGKDGRDAAPAEGAAQTEAGQDAPAVTKVAETTAKPAAPAAKSGEPASSAATQTKAQEPVAPPTPSQPAGPRKIGKIGNVFDQRREAAKKEADQGARPGQRAQAKPATRQPSSESGRRPAPRADQTSRSGAANAATGQQGQQSRSAAAPAAKTSAPVASSPVSSSPAAPVSNAGAPRMREGEILQPPKAPVKKPGKVGNIFDQRNGGAAKSSLAATAELHAQRMANRNNRPPRQGQGQGRPQQGGPRPGGGGRPDGHRGGQDSRFGARPPRGPMGGGFGDKDKDEDQPKFQSRPRKPAKKTPEMPAIFAGRGGRDTSRRQAPNRHDSARRDSDRDRDGGRKLRNRMMPQDDLYEGRRRRSKSGRDKQQVVQPRAVLTHVTLPEQITVKEFAEAIKKTSAEVIKELMKSGVMASINQVIDYDTASLIASEFGIETDQLIEVTEEDILFDDSEDREEDLTIRPPVVVVMGHVDHGKTSLLDYYRKSSVVSGEAGGITQHIGAYMVRINDRKITFLDTPGHEAFTTMRARGAMVTDIAILVVAADDGVMPQTIEAINHAKAAGTQVIVAINKIDKEGANIDRVKQELAKHDLIPEEWGGTTVMVPVSAKTGQGMEELLEMVLLTADVLELKANPNRQAKGTVIEAKLDKNRGPVATLLIQRGTLHAGETLVTGSIVGNVRAMTDANGKVVKSAGPSVPVEIIGLPAVPDAGEIFYAVNDERMAKQLAEKRRVKQRENDLKQSSRMSLDTLFSKLAEGEVKDLNIIVKADVQGSVEAVTQSLTNLTNEQVKVRVIHGAVGAVTESDIRLAEVSNAIVIGFNVRPATNVEDMAKESGVDMRLYRVIYNAIEDIEAAMKGMLEPEFEEVSLGSIEIRNVFKISSVGTVGGGYVLSGKVTRSAEVRVVRDGVVIADDKVASLRRFKDDVREVAQGYECGITLERFHDIKEGDVIEAYEMREIERD